MARRKRKRRRRKKKERNTHIFTKTQVPFYKLRVSAIRLSRTQITSSFLSLFTDRRTTLPARCRQASSARSPSSSVPDALPALLDPFPMRPDGIISVKCTNFTLRLHFFLAASHRPCVPQLCTYHTAWSPRWTGVGVSAAWLGDGGRVGTWNEAYSKYSI